LIDSILYQLRPFLISVAKELQKCDMGNLFRIVFSPFCILDTYRTPIDTLRPINVKKHYRGKRKKGQILIKWQLFVIFVKQSTKKMRKILKMTFWLLMAPFMTCAASNFFFRTVDVKGGLSDNFVRDISSDSYGYIWFSTINGLSRYDGYRIYNYMPQEIGGHDNDVTFVRETADSTLWMLCSGELYTYSRKINKWQKDGAAKLSKLGVQGTMKNFYVDDRHNLWATTESGLYHYDYSQHKALHISIYSKSPITHIVARNGYVAVVTSDNEVYEVAQKERKLIFIAQSPTTTYSRDKRVYLDNDMNLWIYDSHYAAGTQWILSLKTRQWRQPTELKQMGNVFVNAITEDNNGNLWIGTGIAGIFVFERQGGGLVTSGRMTNINPFMPKSGHISCFYLDDNNTMWVGSAKLGAAFADMNRPEFNLISTGDHEDVSSLLQDRQGNLWIGFDGSGIMRRQPSGNTTYFAAINHQIPSDIVTSLTMDANGTVIAGTYGNGLAKFDGARFAPLYPESSVLKYVKSLTTDTHGNLWVATVDRGVVKISNNGSIVNYTSDNSALIYNGTICLACDSLRDIIYIGTSTGVSAYHAGENRFLTIAALDQLKGSYVSSLMVCRKNLLWIGCRDGLWVYNQKDGSIKHLTTEQGMSHNSVRALANIGDRVWASTDNGLTCITVKNDGNGASSYNCYPFHDSDGLHNIVFSNDAASITPNNEVLLGCYSGYVSIPDEDIVALYPKLHVEFTEFRVNGVNIPDFLTDHTIRHNDRLGLSVSAMAPVISQKIQYFYRFEGEEEWMRAPNNILYFASLSPGYHVLQVKAVLPGLMESEPAELAFRMLPPWWLSTPAIIFYILALLAAGYLITRILRYRQKRELAIKRLEMNLEKYEMEEEKIRFFTNISHDLKTPLTLVVAPLEKIRETDLPANVRTEVDVAWRNARQLYDLVLELLDFRRLDVGKETLNIRHGDIVGFVRQTAQGFAFFAPPKQIKMALKLPSSPIEINFDENKLRRIITNLLSNAYKYNTDKGSVTLSLDIQEEGSQRQVVLSVADTGIGVHDKNHIFDRFVQETHGQEQEGSGIGLHIVKQYVDMMGGSVTVKDNLPKGTVFTVTIPVVEKTDGEIANLSIDDSDTAVEATISDNEVQEKPLILVVDDNTDAREFLQRSLADEFDVLTAANGKEGLDQLGKNENICIVVSDVMMPVMDGIEFFRQVKNNINYSHIPFILLTAKSSEESIVAGLEEGVADYITKPYSLSVLRLRIKKILEWSQDVRQSVATGIEIKPSEITVSSLDEELISNVISHIEENIQDQDYSVVQLSSDVGMTRGHLYKKLMAITGKSPLELIRIIKLKRGKSLMEQGKTNISEVADMVGFSAKQFGHYFKIMYGETPSEYLRKHRNQQKSTII
jgi:signal transduction histidine kinase/ligand-binding sensor domain-containing protein/DNA-binding response OmpR family regulator